MHKEKLYAKQIATGFRTMILGLCLFVLELLSLPVFGALQKLQVSGNGFYTDYMKYAGLQPYPLIFMLTAVIVVLGAVWMALGFAGQKKGA